MSLLLTLIMISQLYLNKKIKNMKYHFNLFSNSIFIYIYSFTQFLISLSVMYIPFFSKIKHGKFYKANSSILEIEVPDRISYILTQIPIPILYFSIIFYFNNMKTTIFPSFLLLIHSFYRVIVYPLFRSRHSNKWPLEAIIYYSLINANMGFSLGILMCFWLRKVNMTFNYVISSFYILLEIVLIVHDWIICRSRKESLHDYMIFNKLCFKYITSPQYGFQFLQWMIFSLFSSNYFGTLSYLIWFWHVFIHEAELCHKYYIEKWSNYKLLNRTPLFISFNFLLIF